MNDPTPLTGNRPLYPVVNARHTCFSPAGCEIVGKIDFWEGRLTVDSDLFALCGGYVHVSTEWRDAP